MRKRALSAVLVAGAGAVLATAPAATAAPAATSASVIIIDGYTQTVKESAGIPVSCPSNQVLLGRAHSGDENGSTTYYCGIIILNGQLVQVGAPGWSGAQRESNSLFTAPSDQALVGRYHSGDENGPTQYASASLSVPGQTVKLTSYRWTAGQRESASDSKAGEGEIMVGRSHSGDENGQTYYQYAKVSVG